MNSFQPKSLVGGPWSDEQMPLMDRLVIPKPGSTKQKCETCDKSVWIGPAQQEKAKELVVEIICLPCVVLLTRTGQLDPEVRELSERGHDYGGVV